MNHDPLSPCCREESAASMRELPAVLAIPAAAASLAGPSSADIPFIAPVSLDPGSRLSVRIGPVALGSWPLSTPTLGPTSPICGPYWMYLHSTRCKGTKLS